MENKFNPFPVNNKCEKRKGKSLLYQGRESGNQRGNIQTKLKPIINIVKAFQPFESVKSFPSLNVILLSHAFKRNLVFPLRSFFRRYFCQIFKLVNDRRTSLYFCQYIHKYEKKIHENLRKKICVNKEEWRKGVK